MRRLLMPAILLGLPFIGSATTVFTSAAMNLPSSQLPGFSTALTFSEAAPNQTVVPATASNVGTIPQTVVLEGTTDPGGNGEMTPIDTPITLTLTYTINGTPYTGTLDGTLVQDGWIKSISTQQYMANDLIYFAGNTVSNGLDIASLGNSGYNIETSATSLGTAVPLGKGMQFSATLVNTAPEPATWGVMGLGLLGMAVFGLHRRAARVRVNA